MEKEELLSLKRLMDLAKKSYQTNVFTFSGFLSLPQQDILSFVKEELAYLKFELYGGYSNCERKMVRFGNKEELGYVEDYPIVCIQICPLIEKFADNFTHRDILGAIMNLGIERNTIGDIFIKDKKACFFCHIKISQFIIEQLDQVKHTHVKCEIISDGFDCVLKEPLEKEIIISSLRIDAIVSKLYNVSRNQSLELFRLKKVFVNGKTQDNNSYSLKPRDSVTVRGYGKFNFIEIKHKTKKEKICVSIAIFE